MLFIKRCIWLNSRIGKGCSIFFRVLLLSTTGYSTVWYLPGRTTTVQTYTISGLCWCAFLFQKFWHMLVRSTYKPNFLFGNFGFGVLHSQKCYVMFQCVQCYLPKTELGIRFQQPFSSLLKLIRSLYFLILTVYLIFELCGPGFAPCSSFAFYILE